MARRARTWAIVPPLSAAGVLAAHALAYRALGVPAAPLHDYLAHVPQVLMIALVLGLFALGGATRPARPSPLPFVTLAVGGFAVQEHVERLAHSGHWPFLASSPVFLVGIALQVPFAFAVWLVARWLLAVPGRLRRPAPPRVGMLALPLAPPAAETAVGRPVLSAPARGPPRDSRPR